MKNPRNGKVAFGTMLRAYRLGFAYVARWNGFVRMSDWGPSFLVELRPNDVSELKSLGGKPYRYLGDISVEELVAMSPVLSLIDSIEEPMDFILDDAGEEVFGVD